jgi:hypothetical protein
MNATILKGLSLLLSLPKAYVGQDAAKVNITAGGTFKRAQKRGNGISVCLGTS